MLIYPPDKYITLIFRQFLINNEISRNSTNILTIANKS